MEFQELLEKYNGLIPIDELVGVDVSSFLGITKYEPPVQFTLGDMAGPFPSHLIPVTDEERIQNIPEICEELRGQEAWITQKDDGTSASYVIDLDGTFLACSRNNARKDGDNVYWNLARKYGMPTILEQFPLFAIQGEAVGPGIQKNRLGLSSHELHVFNVVNISTRMPLDYPDMADFCREVGLIPVQLIEHVKDFQYSPEDLLRLAEGKYPSGQEREGIVIRGRGKSTVRGGDWMSFKAISDKFLIRGGD